MKKLIIRGLILAIIIFIVYNIINFYTVPDSTHVAQMGTMEKTYGFEGIITRNESAVKTDTEGIFDSGVSENEMVRKGKMLGTYYEGDIDEATQKELARINEKITDLNASQSFAELSPSDTKKIDAQINEKIQNITVSAACADATGVALLKSEINNLLQRKLALSGDTATMTETLEDLNQKKQSMEAEYGGEKKEIISPSPGIFSTKIDGFESILTKEKTEKLSPSDFNNIKNKKFGTDAIRKSGVICKITDNSQWWISITADENTVKEFPVGSEVLIRFGNGEKDIPAKIETISSEQSKKYVITATSTVASDYAFKNRFVSFDFIKSQFTGLKIPVKAIRVKNGKTGVYVKTENTVKYRETEILYKDDEYAIAKVDNTKANALLLYDEVIVSSDEIR